MAFLANRSVTQRNVAVVASTLTGSTITTSVMTASTLTGSSITASVMTASTLTGSSITASVMGFSSLTGSTTTTSVLGFSTLTGSSIIGTTGQIGSLGYSTLSGSSIVGTIGQIGSLGIGTAPLEGLHSRDMIVVGSTSRGFLRLIASDGVNYIQSGLSATASSIAPLYFTGYYGGPVHMMISSNGSVGIGTTNPSAPLHIRASGTSNPARNGIYVYNTSNTAGEDAIITMRTGGTSGGNPYISWDIADEAGWSMGIDNADNNTLKISAMWNSLTSATKLVVNTSGNVGIGTTNPFSALTLVNGESIYIGNSTASAFRFHHNTSNNSFLDFGSGDLFIRTSTGGATAVNRLVITSGGNVGIGTTSPGYTLDVVGSIKASNTLHATYYSAPDQRGLTNYFKPVSQPAGTFTAGFYEGAAGGYGDGIHFNTWIDATGGKQNLVLFAKATIGMRIYQGEWQSSSSYSTYMDAVMANSSGNVGIGTTTPGAYKLYVQGDIYASGNITGLSDRRFKTNIEPLGGALDAVTALNGYTYFRPDHRPEERQMGLIAQEVQEVYPEAVTYDKENDRYGVNYGAMIAPLVQAMKEMRSEYCAQINHLKEEISSLKARLSV